MKFKFTLATITVGFLVNCGIAIVGLGFTSCDNDEPEQSQEISPDEGNAEDKDGDSSGSDSGVSFDASKLTANNHPRVIFTEEDFSDMAKLYSAGTNPYFNELYDQILYRADEIYVGARDLEHTLDGIRMTDVATLAEERILYCAFAYKMTEKKKYLDQAENDLQTVCKFSDWNHIQHGLDVGEMAIGVGLGYDWLYKDLSDDTKTLVRRALNNFAFTPYLTGTASDHIYTTTLNNHNQIVNAGLICSALAIYEDDEATATEIIEKGVPSNALAQALLYSPDGNTEEGYEYYTYGTIFEVTMLTAMETAIGTDFDLSTIEGFPQSPMYMIFEEGPSGYYFNYSDSNRDNTPCPSQWYFAWKFGDMSALYLEKDRITSGELRLKPVIAWYASKLNVTDIPTPTEHTFYGEGTTPVLLIHDTWTMDENEKFLGVKGGKGSASHGHLDAGTFVFDAEGVRWAADFPKQDYGSAEAAIGSNEFWDTTDGSARWSVFRHNNKNHNTLTVNDADQLSGGVSFFTDRFYDETGKKGGTVDISAPLANQLSSAVRSVYIEGDDLIVTDEIKALPDKDAEVRWTLVTFAVPTVTSNGVTLVINDKTRYLTSTSDVDWTTWSTNSGNSWETSNSGYYECGYTTTIKAGTSETITVRLSR